MVSENIEQSQVTFIKCEKCGKKIIARLTNGIWVFKFGKRYVDGDSPVSMEIYGSIRMQCLRRSCRHINTLNFAPFTDGDNRQSEANSFSESSSGASVEEKRR